MLTTRDEITQRRRAAEHQMSEAQATIKTQTLVLQLLSIEATLPIEAPTPVRQPRAPRVARTEPVTDNQTPDRVIAAIRAGCYAETAIIGYCTNLGSKKSVAKTTVRAMVKSGAVILKDGAHSLPAEPLAAE